MSIEELLARVGRVEQATLATSLREDVSDYRFETACARAVHRVVAKVHEVTLRLDSTHHLVELARTPTATRQKCNE